MLSIKSYLRSVINKVILKKCYQQGRELLDEREVEIWERGQLKEDVDEGQVVLLGKLLAVQSDVPAKRQVISMNQGKKSE